MKLSDLQLTNHGDSAVVRLTGEIDLSNAQDIGEAIALAMPADSHVLVLDLSDLEFFDSAGIRLIYELREKLRARGQILRLVIPIGCPASDALRLAGVTVKIETLATVGDALAH